MLKASKLIFISILFSTSWCWAQTPAAPTAGQADKLDLKKLEDKYWGAQDAEYSVIQNRTYSKEKRFFASLGYGPLVNDEWSVGRMTNLSLGYYFNEKLGVEIAYENGSLKENEGLSQIKQYNGLQPNYNKFVNYTSANLVWAPIYAKMSFMDKKIVYFDMQFAVGIGQMTYESQIDPSEGSNQTKKALGLNFDFTQQLFFSENWAIRVDLKNKFSSQEQSRFRVGGTGSSDRDMGNTSRQDTTFLIGFTYFH